MTTRVPIALAVWMFTALAGVIASRAVVAAQPDAGTPSVFDVKRYGAKGNGATDDTAAIVAAIAAGGNVFDGSSAARVVYLPVGTYRITSTIEVPPNVILRGAGRFSTNLTGSTLNVSFDGAGVRLVRRAREEGSLFHLGGVEDLAFTGLGAAATAASRFIELGDSRRVDLRNGAWNVFIRRCVFSYSHGYGIYSAHSQEALIDENWFRTVKFPISYHTVVGVARITRNTLLDETRIPGAIGMQFRPGPLGGAVGPQLVHNYFLGFEYGVWLTSMVGPSVTGNTFEGIYRTPIVLDQRPADRTADDGNGTVGFTVEANTFVNWAAGGADAPAIVLRSARNGFVGQNTYQSPNGTATTMIDLQDANSSDLTRDNILLEPVLTGTGTARAFSANNPVLTRNWILGRNYLQPGAVTGDITTRGFGVGESGRTWWDGANRRLRLWDGSSVRTFVTTSRVTLAYASIIQVDAALGSWFSIAASERAGFVIANPSNGTLGQAVTITVQNRSGGALGAVKWGNSYKLAPWTPPAKGTSRSITFAYDGAHWVEIGRTIADVPD